MEISMKIFMGLMFLVGLVLTVYAFRIAPFVKDCNSKAQNAARGLLVLGIMMISVAATYMVCGCGMEVEHSSLGMFFIVFMLLVSIVTMVLTSIIHGSCNKAKDNTSSLIVLSVLLTVMTGGYLIYNGYLMMNNSQKVSFGF